VRVRDDQVLISDGPFAETKEQIAGYDVLECSSLAEAIEVAAKHPVASFGAVEVRPFGPDGWWRSADRREPGDSREFLMIHRVDVTAPVSPADNCTVPGSPAAHDLQVWDTETEKQGVKLAGGRLDSTARTVRVRDGEMLVTDGPFAETKELVAGLNILSCPTLAEAAEIAAQHPTARIGTLELRPFAQDWRPGAPPAASPAGTTPGTPAPPPRTPRRCPARPPPAAPCPGPPLPATPPDPRAPTSTAAARPAPRSIQETARPGTATPSTPRRSARGHPRDWPAR
jgi:hypothetical protein